MALVFPSSPSLNQTYSSGSSVTFVWNGDYWESLEESTAGPKLVPTASRLEVEPAESASFSFYSDYATTSSYAVSASHIESSSLVVSSSIAGISLGSGKYVDFVNANTYSDVIDGLFTLRCYSGGSYDQLHIKNETSGTITVERRGIGKFWFSGNKQSSAGGFVSSNLNTGIEEKLGSYSLSPTLSKALTEFHVVRIISPSLGTRSYYMEAQHDTTNERVQLYVVRVPDSKMTITT